MRSTIPRIIAVTAVLLTVLSCDSTPRRSGPLPAAPAAGESVPFQVTRVPLDPQDSSRQRIGSFVYAGGIEIRAAAGVEFELSDVRLTGGDRFVAISDQGRFYEGRLLFDEAGQLSGVMDLRVIPLRDEQGRTLTPNEADAEGLEVLPGGDRLVSFEKNHRIWRYPADGGVPRPVPKPDAAFPANEAMEALTYYPAAGPGAYLVGAEGGSIWLCGLETMCRPTEFGRLVPAGLGLTALAAYGDHGAFAMLGRSWDRVRGNRISVRLIDTAGAPSGRVVDEMTIARPLTVDNFEGVAVTPRADGGLRLYLLSDDNGSATQHTYLLAFDWQQAR
jgi:hypothetical protein